MHFRSYILVTLVPGPSQHLLHGEETMNKAIYLIPSLWVLDLGMRFLQITRSLAPRLPHLQFFDRLQYTVIKKPPPPPPSYLHTERDHILEPAKISERDYSVLVSFLLIHMYIYMMYTFSLFRVSFGTTKYCTYFLRGTQCTKPVRSW